MNVLRSEAEEGEEFNVIIEICKCTSVKYEIDKASGSLFVDRILPESVKYPRNYGYVPKTLCEDGDALDVIVLCDANLQAGCVVRCRPIGVMYMTDESGRDPKVLAVPVHDVTPRFDNFKDIGDVSEYELDVLVHFFANYKGLTPGKWVKIDEKWGGRAEAVEEYDKAVVMYLLEAKEAKQKEQEQQQQQQQEEKKKMEMNKKRKKK